MSGEGSAEAARRLDPVTLEIIWSRLLSVVEEASAALVRSAFSVIVREAYDLQCTLLDAVGDSVVQSRRTIPPFIAAIPTATKAFLEAFPADSLESGDVLVTNDPWLGAGQLNDVICATPIFLRGRLIGFAANVAHWTDIGGRPWSVEAQQIFEDGFMIPPLKAVAAGKPSEMFLQLVAANVRVPDEVLGDFWAQVASNQVMARRLVEILDEYGLDDFAGLSEEIKDRSEAAMRDVIRALPPGTYHHAETLDGPSDDVLLQLAITVGDGKLTLDFTGSSPEQPWAGNSVTNVTSGYALHGVLAALASDVPNNSGANRPIEIVAPEGTIVNARRPAAVNSRQMTSHFLPSAVLQCLAKIKPEIGQAGSGSLWVVYLLGRHRGRVVAGPLLIAGGLGAQSDMDGLNCVCFPAAVQSTPLEVLERNFPIRFGFRRIRRTSGGDGAHPGGCGQDVQLQILGDQGMIVSACLTRVRNAAGGLFGAGPGAVGEFYVGDEAWDGRAPRLVPSGTEVLVRTPGGGGFGGPAIGDGGTV